ncbi:hypothetical protein [Micromonospora sp. KC606]|nr:hypothetical protein [Micromonospora sp. KC606]
MSRETIREGAIALETTTWGGSAPGPVATGDVYGPGRRPGDDEQC